MEVRGRQQLGRESRDDSLVFEGLRRGPLPIGRHEVVCGRRILPMRGVLDVDRFCSVGARCATRRTGVPLSMHRCFAPLKPAEFVVIRLQQMAGQIDT